MLKMLMKPMSTLAMGAMLLMTLPNCSEQDAGLSAEEILGDGDLNPNAANGECKPHGGRNGRKGGRDDAPAADLSALHSNGDDADVDDVDDADVDDKDLPECDEDEMAVDNKDDADDDSTSS